MADLSLPKDLPITEYVLYLFLNGLRGYLKNGEDAACGVGKGLGHLVILFPPMVPGTCYENTYTSKDILNSREEVGNAWADMLKPIGRGIGRAVGRIPTVIEVLINLVTRCFKRHSYIGQSLNKLQSIKRESFAVKEAFINNILNQYKDSSSNRSKSTTALLQGLTEEKSIDDHIDTLIAYVSKTDDKK